MRTTVRYNCRPLLWATVGKRGITMTALAAVTPNSQQWVSRVMHNPHQTVSPEWANAVAAYLDLPFATLFDAVVVPLSIVLRPSGRSPKAA